MGQGCSTHLLLCLDHDLEESAKMTIYKSSQSNGGQTKWLSCYSWSNQVAENADYMKRLMALAPPLELDADSKLTIMCHASSNPMGFGQKLITPRNLARLIQVTLHGQKIKRVSILGCEAGGRKTFKGFDIQPQQSAAFQFASHAGRIARTVTARTGRTITAGNRVTLRGQTSYENVRQLVNVVHRRHHGQEDKVVFTPHAEATTGVPRAPGWAFETYGA